MTQSAFTLILNFYRGAIILFKKQGNYETILTWSYLRRFSTLLSLMSFNKCLSPFSKLLPSSSDFLKFFENSGLSFQGNEQHGFQIDY